MSELSDQDEGVFATYEEQDSRSGKYSAEQQVSLEEALEAERSAKARIRQLESQIRVLYGEEPLPGFEPESGSGGVESEQSSPESSYRGNVDHIEVRVGDDGPAINDLVTASVREVVIQLLPELLRDALPRRRGIDVFVPGEGRAKIPADEVIARTYAAVVSTVAQLAGRSVHVPDEDAYWAMGTDDEVAGLLGQVARAAPRRAQSVNRSRSV